LNEYRSNLQSSGHVDKQSFGGTGLGLSICKHLSKLWVEIGVNEPGRRRSDVLSTILLEPSALNVPVTKLEMQTNGHLKSSLWEFALAEDNTVNQLIARKMPRKHGMRVDIAANGNVKRSIYLGSAPTI
jgi:hypothetical protein